MKEEKGNMNCSYVFAKLSIGLPKIWNEKISQSGWSFSLTQGLFRQTDAGFLEIDQSFTPKKKKKKER